MIPSGLRSTFEGVLSFLFFCLFFKGVNEEVLYRPCCGEGTLLLEQFRILVPLFHSLIIMMNYLFVF